MKNNRILSMILAFALSLALAGCGGERAASKAAAGSALSESSVSRLLENAANAGSAENSVSDPAETGGQEPQSGDPAEEEGGAAFSHDGIDLDLTRMSGTMVYGQVAGMMYTPDGYVGKTIRIRGKAFSAYYDETDTTYHTVFVSDAAACCAQGIEYVLADKSAYPEEETEITVTGVFELYDELGLTYCRLANAEISL